MLSISTRARPCTLRARRESSRRVTFTRSPSTATATSGSMRRASLPFGPSTRTSWSVTWIFTPAGTLTGSFPLRDMSTVLPDRADELAADVLAPGGAVGQDALRCGEHVDAEAAANRRDVLDADVHPQARAAHAADAGDDGPALAVVPQ